MLLCIHLKLFKMHLSFLVYDNLSFYAKRFKAKKLLCHDWRVDKTFFTNIQKVTLVLCCCLFLFFLCLEIAIALFSDFTVAKLLNMSLFWITKIRFV